jgi:RNase P protein component
MTEICRELHIGVLLNLLPFKQIILGGSNQERALVGHTVPTGKIRNAMVGKRNKGKRLFRNK